MTTRREFLIGTGAGLAALGVTQGVLAQGAGPGVGRARSPPCR
jgi:hypothetical protein